MIDINAKTSIIKLKTKKKLFLCFSTQRWSKIILKLIRDILTKNFLTLFTGQVDNALQAP